MINKEENIMEEIFKSYLTFRKHCKDETVLSLNPAQLSNIKDIDNIKTYSDHFIINDEEIMLVINYDLPEDIKFLFQTKKDFERNLL